MSEFGSSSLPERNPATHETYRREVLWQITIPLVITALAFLALAVLVVLGDSGDLSRWADISLIWLIIPAIVAALVLLVLLAAVAFAMRWLLVNVPRYTLMLQNIFSMVRSQVRKASDAAVEPVIKVESWKASARTLRRELRSK